ncbi:MAG: single-stranded-DNA-specific exonuclease RecJ [Bacillota bacterium]
MNINYRYSPDRKIPEWMLQEVDGSRFLAKLLLARGLDERKKVQIFLNPDSYQPFKPEKIPGLKAAAKLFLQVIRSRKNICVYGDYDVDGIVATSILVDLGRKVGADVIYHIPDRIKEGYGLNKEVIDRLKNRVDLIITCDCGISNAAEVAYARRLGIDVIVTDHHQLPSDLPEANHIVSPKLMDNEASVYELPGAGIAYFFAQEVLNSLNRKEETAEYLDILALAIVADVVPLLRENRFLLNQGLPALQKTIKPGLIALFNEANISAGEIDPEAIGYQISPLLNAAGRIDDASKGVELLLASEEEATNLARELFSLNQKRKQIQDQMINEANELLEKELESGQPVFIYDPTWHQGLLGIVAGRIADAYDRPAVVMTSSEEDDFIVGSARSVEGIDINLALRKCKEMLIKYGGHAGAAGFSVKKEFLSFLQKKLGAILSESMKNNSKKSVHTVDFKLNFAEIDFSLYQEMEKLGPFGQGNPQPIFTAVQTKIINARQFSGDKHLNLILEQANTRVKAVWWNATSEDLSQRNLVVYNIKKDNYRGNKNLKLNIVDLLEADIISDYNIIGAGRNSQDLIDFQIKDQRGQVKTNLGIEGKDMVYYREGFGKIGLTPVIDRYQLKAAYTLILLTVPPSLEILRELILSTGASELILAYARAEVRREKKFLHQLAALIKGWQNKEGRARVDLYRLSTLTVQLEETVDIGLRLLESQGYIDIFTHDNRYYWLRPGSGQRSGKEEKYKTSLQELLQERQAFTRFLVESSIDDIKFLLK